MKGLFTKMFSGGSAEKVADALISTGDFMHWSKEEKAAWLLKYHEATAGQNLARRFLGLLIVSYFLFISTIYIVALKAAPNFASDLLTFMTDVYKEPFMIVVGFYFLAGVFNQGKK